MIKDKEHVREEVQSLYLVRRAANRETREAEEQSKLIKPATGESVGPVSHANPAQSAADSRSSTAPRRNRSCSVRVPCTHARAGNTTKPRAESRGDLKNRMPTVNCPII